MTEVLASRILDSTKPSVSESDIYVFGQLVNNRLERIQVSIRPPADKDRNVFERSADYENRARVQSLRALLYQLHHDWSPRRLILAISVLDCSQLNCLI